MTQWEWSTTEVKETLPPWNYELPLIDFGTEVDCPYCINSSGIVGGYEESPRNPETGEPLGWGKCYFYSCPHCGGSGKFWVMKRGVE